MILHFLAERDFDFVFARRNIRYSGFRHGLDDDGRRRIEILPAGGLPGKAAQCAGGKDEEQGSCFHGLFSPFYLGLV